MSTRDPETALRQMLDHAHEVREKASERDRQALEEDRDFELAVVRLLEVVGEAATRVPDEVQDRNPEVPWAEVVAMRNRLIHAYDAVDPDIVWRIVTEDIPELVEDLKPVLEAESSD